MNGTVPVTTGTVLNERCPMRRISFLLIPLTLAALGHSGPVLPDSSPRPAAVRTVADSGFAQLIARLSEPGGFFDSDNLISNEASYLHVLGTLRTMEVSGGAYIGVGPDQNFSYIAQIRPDIAFIIDIRRDNLLHHLMLKAIFANARNRMEYLSLLLGRAPPATIEQWDSSSLEEIIEYIDVMPAERTAFENASARLLETIESFGVPLDEDDIATIRRFHSAFHRAGLDLRFTSHGRGSRSYYPNLRTLMLETDLEGNQASYLADEERFGVVRKLQNEDRIVPVVGDLAGDHALQAIGAEIRDRGLLVSAFYTSNVEYYLMLDGSFDRFAATVAESLPHRENSLIIRSYFSRGWPHPQNVRGYYATQLVEPMATFVAEQKAAGYRSYADLVTRNIVAR